MKYLITIMLVLHASVAQAALRSESEWTFGFSHFWEDRCYTTNTPNCQVEGNEIRVHRDTDDYFFTASYARFRSDGGQLVGDLFELGVGDRFTLTDRTQATFRAMLNVEPDESRNANSNFNKGFSLGAAVSTQLREMFDPRVPVEIGFGLIYEDKQNCSHPGCHELKEKKGRMELVQAQLFLRTRLRRSGFSLFSSVSQIVVYPDAGSMNGRRQEQPTLRIGLEYRP